MCGRNVYFTIASDLFEQTWPSIAFHMNFITSLLNKWFQLEHRDQGWKKYWVFKENPKNPTFFHVNHIFFKLLKIKTEHGAKSVIQLLCVGLAGL